MKKARNMGTIMVVLAVCALMLFMVMPGQAFVNATAKPATVKKNAHPKVQFVMNDGKIMVFELYPEYAPATVANFVKLVKANFYDGLTFHRIVDGFMIQGGDPKGNGTGGSDKTIFGEFSNNGFVKNTLKHTKGVISMARSQSYDSASSQFFIMDGAVSQLDGDYAAFGKLITGMKTLDELSKTPVKIVKMGNYEEKSRPIKNVVIKKVILLNNGN